MSRGSILLVEDSSIAQMVGRQLFEKLGYVVDIAASGESALEYCQRRHYQLIFMDIGLPGIDGIEAAKIIRQTDSLNQQVPIIALTAHEDAELKRRAVQAGMNDYLVKPLSSQSASNMVEKHAENDPHNIRHFSY